MQNQNLGSTLQILLARYGSQVLIPLVEASAAVGISTQTARNKLSSGTFPMPTVTVGSRRFIHVSDLAEFVESLREKSAKPKRGRPTKASKYAAEVQN